jgi:tetratricopeptide (TPR) repeat protein
MAGSHKVFRTIFGSKKKKGAERIIVFLVLPLLSILTLAIVFLLLHEGKKVPHEAVSDEKAPERPTELQPSLEPAALLQKLVEAEALEERGDFVAAETAFAALTISNQESDRAWGGLGRSLLATKQYQQAVLALDHACRLNVIEARHFAARGDARRAMNDPKHAIRDFRDALSLDPSNAQTSNTILFLVLEIGDAGLFDRTLEKIRQADPEAETKWILALAASQIRTGTSEEAVAILKKAREILPPSQYQKLLADRIFSDERSQNLIQTANQGVSP